LQAVTNSRVKNVTVRYIGGSYIDSGNQARYGNGIEFGLNASNVSIDNCDVAYVFDACYTYQAWSSGGNTTIANVSLKNSLGGHCAYGFEFFSSRTTGGSVVQNVNVSHNTFYELNNDWHGNDRPFISHYQCYRLARSSAGTVGFRVYDNVCYNARNLSVRVGGGSATNWDSADLQIDYNYYFNDSSNNVLRFSDWLNTKYNSFSTHQVGTGNDSNGKYVNPLFSELVFYVPYSDSPLCGNASDGGDIGYVACGSLALYTSGQYQCQNIRGQAGIGIENFTGRLNTLSSIAVAGLVLALLIGSFGIFVVKGGDVDPMLLVTLVVIIMVVSLIIAFGGDILSTISC